MGVSGCRKLDASSISLFFPNISINGEKTVKAIDVTVVFCGGEAVSAGSHGWGGDPWMLPWQP